MVSPSKRVKAGATWDSARQAQYRQVNPHECLTFHMVLDASPSMAGDDARNLMKAYNLYQDWLRAHVSPMSQVEMTVFSSDFVTLGNVPIGSATPLTPSLYDPMKGDGTALYRAVGEVLAQPQEGGQHILVVFTDGLDNISELYGWTAEKVSRLLSIGTQDTAETDTWLCVYLAAYPEGLETGLAMGFVKENCLVFTSDKIPDAFKTLTQATLRYLKAPEAERKLLAAGGIF